MIRQPKSRGSRGELTPMIDVTFLLLIFFLCTLEIRTLEGKLQTSLPRDAGGGPGEPVERFHVRATVAVEGERLGAFTGAPWTGQGTGPGTGAGPYVFGPGRRVTYRVGPHQVAGLEEVAERARTFRRDRPEVGALIDARAGIVHGEAVALLDLLAGAGFEQISPTSSPVP